MTKLRVLDLFSGIGGFSLGLERAVSDGPYTGFSTVAFCEIEPFPRKVLAKHWPEVPCYDDVRTLTAERLAADGIAVDIVTGGFPCQDISVAGKRAGIGEGTRSGLWSECIRLVGELRPQYAIFENVANLLSGPTEKPGAWFSRILADLAECGYDAEWENIPASSVGAPHRRERIWIVAYPKQTVGAIHSICDTPAKWFAGTHGDYALPSRIIADDRQERAEGCQQKSLSGFPAFSWCKDVRGVEDYFRLPAIPKPLIRGSLDGIPNWVDRVSACGNAVVPQIPELIGRAILAAQ